MSKEENVNPQLYSHKWRDLVLEKDRYSFKDSNLGTWVILQTKFWGKKMSIYLIGNEKGSFGGFLIQSFII